MNDPKTDDHRVFYQCLTAAREAVRRIKTDHDEHLVNRLAYLCHAEGLTLETAIQQCLMRTDIDIDREFIRQIFYSYYERDLDGVLPDKYLSHQALNSYRTEYFLLSHYRFRRNVLSGAVEFCLNDGRNHSMKPLTPEIRNTMTLQAQQLGLEAWERNLDLYINSRLIEHYNPMKLWLDSLPRWDRQDRTESMARKLKTTQQDWPGWFHQWMLSMMARWMGLDPHTGADMLLLLVGNDIDEMSLFCRRLVPDRLVSYYLEAVEFRDDADFLMALRQHALIFINGVDDERKGLQPLYNLLLQRGDMQIREPYGRIIDRTQRYAALVAAIDNLHPIVNPALSRRIVCVHVDGRIDLSDDVDMEQLFAQLKEEVSNGQPYWMSDSDLQSVRVQNGPFQKIDDLEQMMRMMFRQERVGEKVRPLFVEDIVMMVQREYPYWSPQGYANQDIGYAMQHAGFRRTRRNGRSAYFAVPKNMEQVQQATASRAAKQQKEDENPLASALLHGLGNLIKQN